MKKLKDSQFIRIITKIKNKLFINRQKIILFSLFFSVGSFFFFVENVYAIDFVNGLAQFGAWAFEKAINFVLNMVQFLFHFFLKLAQYNGYIDGSQTPIVQIGWILVRDVANMFFVVIMLVIAFGTILGLENYQWNKLLGKLIFAAIFINFSNMICGLIIDVAYVFSLTFLNAIINTAGTNLVNTVHMDQLNNFVSNESKLAKDMVSIFVANVVAFIFSFILLLTIGAYTVVMLLRMVVLWVLIILSPLAFIMQVMPQTQEYAKQWWNKFIKQVLVLPVMVFFLWLTLSTMSGGDVATRLGVDMGDSVLGDQVASLTEISRFSTMANFFVPIAMLVVGLTVVGQMGVVGGSMAGKALDFGKKVATIATGYALGRKLVGGAVGGAVQGAKFLGKKAAMNVPIVGGNAWVRRGKSIASLAKIGTSKVSQGRNFLAKKLEKGSADRAKAKDDLRKGKITQEQYNKQIEEMGHNGAGWAVGRFGARFFAKRLESGGRADKRVENLKKAAESERKVEEANYSLSGTKGGRMKTYNEARAQEAEEMQKDKATGKVAEWRTAFAEQASTKLEEKQNELKQAEEELTTLSESKKVHEERTAAKTALDGVREKRDGLEKEVIEVEGTISIEQDKIDKLDEKIDPGVMSAMLGLEGINKIYEGLSLDDKKKVDGLSDGRIDKRSEAMLTLSQEEGDEGIILKREEVSELENHEKQKQDEKTYKKFDTLYSKLSDDDKKEVDKLAPDEKGRGEAIRQLLAGGKIAEGNQDFNVAFRQLFIDTFKDKKGKEAEVAEAEAAQKQSGDLRTAQDGRRTDLENKNDNLQTFITRTVVPAEDKYQEWTAPGVETKKAALRAKIADPEATEEDKAKARTELESLSTTIGTEEEIAEAEKKVTIAKKGVKKVVEKDSALRALSAKKGAAVATGRKEEAELKLGNKFDTTEVGSKFIESLNKIEFGKKQAEDFSKNLKGKNLEKALAGAAKEMKSVIDNWDKTGKGNLDELNRLLEKASGENIFVKAAVQTEKLSETESSKNQVNEKVKNLAADLSRNIPRGGRTNSTVMTSTMKEGVEEFNNYERADGSKQAVKNIFSAIMKRSSGKELDLEDRRKSMSAWLKIDSESWNDDFFDAMLKMVDARKNGKLTGQDEGIAREIESFLQKSGIKYNFDTKSGKYKTDGTYGREMSALMQNLATTGGDVDAALAHKKVSEKQQAIFDEIGERKDYWEVAKTVDIRPGVKAESVLRKSYADNQDYIQVAAKEFKKNALANGHHESGMNQEFDVSAGIFRFNSALDAEASMLTEMSKRTQADLLKSQIHSFGELDMNSGLMQSINSNMFSGLTKNLKDDYELRGMNPRTLMKLFGLHESEQVDTSGGIVHIGGARMRDSYRGADGKVDNDGLDLHLLKDILLNEVTGNARGFGLMVKRLFNVSPDKMASGNFTMKLAGGTEMQGIAGMIKKLQELQTSGKLGFEKDKFNKILSQLQTIQSDWSKGHVLSASSSSRRGGGRVEEE